MIAWRSLFFGFIMALIDTGMLGIIKKVSLTGPSNPTNFVHTIQYNLSYMFVPTLIYALQPWIFLTAIKTESMTVMNLMWDLTSDVLVSCVGLLYFNEKLSFVRMCGLFLAFVSLGLLSWKDD
jgi:multidrug transporter EmrE-like cation transporter